MSSPSAAVPPRALERGFALVFVLFAAFCWSAFTLAQLGRFSREHMIGLFGGVALAAFWWIWRGLRTEPRCAAAQGRGVTLSALVLAAGLAANAYAFRLPIDPVMNGSDASVYLNIAEIIRDQGGLTVRDERLRDMGSAVREALLDRDPLWPHLLNVFPGGLQLAPGGETLQPSFFHLLPAAMAGAMVVTGSSEGSMLITAIGALLTLTAVWVLAARLGSPLAAAVSVVLLCANFAQIWFGRLPTTEAVAAGFLLPGLAFLVRARREGSRHAGVLAGVAFGLAAATRLDVLVIVIPLVALCLVAIRWRGNWTPALTACAVALTLMTTQAVVHAMLVAQPYVLRILWRAVGTDWWVTRTTWLVPALALAAGVLVALVRWAQARGHVTPVTRVMLAAGLLAAIVRSGPELWSGSIALLLTPLGLVVMVTGAVWVALDEPEPDTLLVVVLFVASAVIFVQSPAAGRTMPLNWRRIVPVVLPLGTVLSAIVIARLWGVRGWGRLVSAVVCLTLVGSAVARSHVLWRTTQMAGLRAQLAAFDAALPAGAWLLTDATTPSHLGLTLRYSFDRPGAGIRRQPTTAQGIELLAATLAARGVPLLLAVSPTVTDGALSRADVGRVEMTPVLSRTLEWDEIERSRDHLPTAWRHARQQVEVYAISPLRAQPLPVVADIGQGDLAWRGAGFFDPEPVGVGNVRWAGGHADVRVPQVQASASAVLTLRVAAPRAPGLPPPSLRLSLDGALLSVIDAVPSSMTSFTVPLPPRARDRLAAAPAWLTLDAPTFVPRTVGLGDDGRTLGVMVDWVRIDAGAPR